jgi:hypothetical protein
MTSKISASAERSTDFSQIETFLRVHEAGDSIKKSSCRADARPARPRDSRRGRRRYGWKSFRT